MRDSAQIVNGCPQPLTLNGPKLAGGQGGAQKIFFGRLRQITECIQVDGSNLLGKLLYC